MNKKYLTNQGKKKPTAQDNILKVNDPKEIDSNQQKKENKTKLKKEILSDDITENRENKEQLSKRQKKGVKEKTRR